MKSYNLIIKEEAKHEIVEAYNWYEDKQNKLGDKLLVSLDECFNTILKNPKIFAKQIQNIRQAIVKTFPYVVIYEIEQKQIIVYAVFNTNQNPGKWIDMIG